MLGKGGWVQWLGFGYFLLVVGEEWIGLFAGMVFVLFFFSLGCGWEGDCDSDWVSFCCWDGFGDGFLWYFFSPSSANDSSLSLLLFKLNDFSIVSCCVFPFFFFLHCCCCCSCWWWWFFFCSSSNSSSNNGPSHSLIFPLLRLRRRRIRLNRPLWCLRSIELGHYTRWP